MKAANKGAFFEMLDYRDIFYQSFLNSNDAVMISDANSRILFVNRAFSHLYGYSENEVLGKYASIVRHQDTPDSVFQAMWRDLMEESKGFWRGELRNRKHNGTAVDVLLTITAIRDEEGKVVAHVSNAQDISEKKQIEKTLIQQEKLFSIGLLASGIAHEIGSPLNVISGRAEMIKAQLSEQPKLASSLAIIIQQTERISELIQALLNFSRPTGQITPSAFQTIDLHSVVEECEKLFQKPLKDQGVKFTTRKKAPTKIVWNFFKAEQIFVNLIQNALHAVEAVEKPEISILFREATPDELGRLSTAPTGAITVVFKDNGTGIDQDGLNRVFDPFYTTKDIGMGTGLGLSVVYGLVEEVNGTIRVDSEPGKGAVFTIVVPRAEE